MQGFIVTTVLECIVAGFIIWGLFFEDTLVRFEQQCGRRMAKLLRRLYRRLI